MKQKKSTKFVVGIVLVVVGSLGFIGSFGTKEGKATAFIGSVIIATVGALLLYFDNKKRETDANSTTVKQKGTHATTTPIPENEKNYNLFDDIYNKCVLTYEYEQNICLQEGAISSISGNGGKPLEFVQEPQNEYDNKAIAIFLNSRKIGYVYKGKTQDMLNDWIRRGDTYKGYINKIFLTENKATYKIGFYKTLSSYEHKTFPLIKTGKKVDEYTKREDNLLSCEIGDAVTIESDIIEDCYTVFNASYEEIGELGAGAKSFIDDGIYKKLVGTIEQFEYDDNGKPKLKITVFLIP